MSIGNWVYQHFDDPREGQEDIVVLCPFCVKRIGSPDVSGHLYISTLKSMCHCFRCGYAGSWLRLIRDVTGSSYKEARDELHDDGFVPLYKLIHRQEDPPEIQMPASFRTIAQARDNCNPFGKKLAKSATRYVKERVAPYWKDWERLLDRWGIWLDVEGIGKLVLPVERGWWQERDFSKENPHPKYVSVRAPKEDRLYNYSALRKETVYVAEGIISAACIGESAVALCGKHATPEQIRRLGVAGVEKYVVCLDSDAEREALEIAGQLHSFGKEVWIRQYADGDPASCTEYEDVEFSWKTTIEKRLT